MAIEQPEDGRARRQRRDAALTRVHYVWIAALLSGSVSALLLLWVGIDTGEWGLTAAYLFAALLSVGLGWLVARRHSQVAAGVLLANAVVTPVARWFQTGRPGPIVLAALLAYVYFRGFEATMDLAELRKADAPEAAA